MLLKNKIQLFLSILNIGICSQNQKIYIWLDNYIYLKDKEQILHNKESMIMINKYIVIFFKITKRWKIFILCFYGF